MKPPHHPMQEERLKSLHSYAILDTGAEQDFDEIVQLIAAICEVPVALISFVDQDRQWFKAHHGLDMQETPLEASICGHAILQDEFIEISDTLQDWRTRDNVLCSSAPDLRFYAGALLKDDEGLPLGTLCVLDTTPRSLTTLQRDAIKVLARQVMVRLEMRKSLRLARLMRQEVDHRVKNSLQSVASYIRIHARKVDNADAKAAFAAIQNRIEAISILHEQLYQNSSGMIVTLDTYLNKLRSYLAKLAPDGVQVVASAVPVKISAREAANLGTLLNEFALNAFKYAFPEGRTGKVLLEAVEGEDGRVVVRCVDNGIGMKTRPGREGGGLGTQVAMALCAQIDAKLAAETGPEGTVISVSFQPDQAWQKKELA